MSYKRHAIDMQENNLEKFIVKSIPWGGEGMVCPHSFLLTFLRTHQEKRKEEKRKERPLSKEVFWEGMTALKRVVIH